MAAVVVKNISNQFTISDNGELYIASARGNLKQDKLVVGDKVEYSKTGSPVRLWSVGADGTRYDYVYKGAVITKVLERKNTLIRPNIANIDNLIIVLSPLPKPDYILIDKLILTCLDNDIKPILCANKEDMSLEFINEVKAQYKDVVLDIVSVSALNGVGFDKLMPLLKGKISAFAGQSAVGKSTILNALTGANSALTGTISDKTLRGRHTTRHTEMFEIEPGTYVIDTPGFSMLNLPSITYDNLKYFYPDFAEFECKYTSCTHTKEQESECAIKQAVKSNKIDKDRYERYIYIYNELKERKKVYEKD